MLRRKGKPDKAFSSEKKGGGIEEWEWMCGGAGFKEGFLRGGGGGLLVHRCDSSHSLSTHTFLFLFPAFKLQFRLIAPLTKLLTDLQI